MKIEITEGCIAFGTTVDGVNICDMSKEQYMEIVDKILSAIRTGIVENTVSFDSLINCLPYDNYEHDDNVCEQCGDTVDKTTWNI